MTDEEFKSLLLQKLSSIEKKVDLGFAEVEGEFKRIDTELKRLEEKIDSVVKGLEEKIDFLEKQLDNANFVNRITISALLIGLLAGLTKLFFFTRKIIIK